MSIVVKRGETQGNYLTIAVKNPSLDPSGLCYGATGTLAYFLYLELETLLRRTHILSEMESLTLCREQLVLY